jgi:hypothetical protein
MSRERKPRYKPGVDIDKVQPQHRYLFEDFSQENQQAAEQKRRADEATDQHNKRSTWVAVLAIVAFVTAMIGLRACVDGPAKFDSSDDPLFIRK